MKPDTTISHYRIRASLGAGGMGEVFLAEDTKLQRKVAIKVLLPGLAQGGIAGKRLLREARAAAALDHPNICAVYEVAEDDGRTFIVMQYVEGETLQARMRRGALPFLEVLSIARQVVDALSEAHAHDTIHRDIKPANIMVSARGHIKVMDFGLATSGSGVSVDAETATGLTSPGAVLGTVPYMSPEQVRGEQLDARTDLFSFGVVLYELVTGQQPFAAPSTAGTLSAILTEEPQPLGRYSKDSTAELERIVAKALRKDREARYQTAKDLLIDLRALEDDVRRTTSGARSGPVSGAPMPSTSPVASQAQASAPPASATDSVPAEVMRRDAGDHDAIAHGQRWRRVAAVAAIVVIAAAGFWIYRGRSQVASAQAQIPRIEALVEAKDLTTAYDLAIEARRLLPADPVLTRLMPIVSDLLSVTTNPAGATVYLTRLNPGDRGRPRQRQRVGVTPIAQLEIARGAYVLAVELDGYAPIERPISGLTETLGKDRYLSPPVRITETLLPASEVPDRMVFVPGGEYRMVAWGRLTDARPKLDDYFIDKYEVSNKDFREFIVAGGYLKKEYWKHPFIDSGRVVSWEEAMKQFADRGGLPGPRSWSGQVFPPGSADDPVTGVSWYEAAAYAEFRGKELPTAFQWEKAARNGNAQPPFNFLPWGVLFPGGPMEERANFDSTTVPVTANPFGASPFGAYNMAGNVAEWCRNDTSAGFITTGGAYGDPVYMFAQYGTYPGFYTSEKLGFRGARRRAPDAPADASAMRIEIASDIPKYTPTTAATFDELRAYFRYEKTPLSPVVEAVNDGDEWRRETITFAGVGGERAIAYLYLPIHAERPLQVIHFLPGTGVEMGGMALSSNMEALLGPSVRAGRAMFGVALRGYQERRGATIGAEPAVGTAEFRDKIVNWVTDLRRGLDYLETRSDVDQSRIAFVAQSSGARNGITLAAIESRYRSVFFQGAGVSRSQTTWVKGTSPIDFAPHIKGPTMLLQGRYDEAIDLKKSAEPLFALLPEPKQLRLYEAGHIPPGELIAKELNAWLDQTLGPVKR